MQNVINFFELPVTNFDRAVQFYESILAIELHKEIFNGEQTALFPADSQEAAAGALVFRPAQKPSMDGTTIYLNTAGKMTAIISRIEAAGGKVLLPRTSIGDPGFISLLIDTEGNKVGLHEPV